MIYESAYDTSVGVSYSVKSINDSIVEAIYSDHCKVISDGVYGVITGNKAQNFPHPLMVVENGKNKGVFIDLRHMNKAGIDEEFEVRVRDKSEYNLLLLRAKLTKVWNERNKDILKHIHPKLIAIYSEWISNNISKRFALDYKDQITIKTLCGLYYLSLFSRVEEWDKHYTANALLQLNQILKIPTVFAKEVILDIEKPLTNIASLTDTIKEKTDNVRLSTLTPATLLTIINSTWFGNNHGEILGIAIEHPPTFIALVYTAINDNLFKRVGFSQVVQNVLKNEGRNVTVRIDDLLS